MGFVVPRELSDPLRSFGMLIDGRIVHHADAAGAITRESPAHAQPVTRYAAASPQEVDQALDSARRAFDSGPWPRTTLRERSEMLGSMARIVEENLEELALLDCLEAGKPLAQARGEIADCAEMFRYAGSLVRVLHGESYNGLRSDILASTVREPVGVVAMITPWNFPFLIACQKIPFALAAGCTIVIKPSELTSASLLRFGELIADALPAGVLNIIVGDGSSVGERIVSDARVDMVTFTGSTRAGRAVGIAAAGGIKKLSLELGGKNPQIICAGADLEAAAAAAVHGAFFNAGQCCQASGRILVERSVLREFTDRVSALAETVRFGDPFDDTVRMGAIVSSRQLDRVAELVATVRQDGGQVTYGGTPVEGSGGYFFPPTIVTGVGGEARISQEEVFGPVLGLTAFDTFDEAILLANGSSYGLGAGLWSANPDHLVEGAKRIRAGTVWMNCFMEVFSEMPFGGFRQSGIGRECGSHSVSDYTEEKSVVLSRSRTKQWN